MQSFTSTLHLALTRTGGFDADGLKTKPQEPCDSNMHELQDTVALGNCMAAAKQTQR